MKSYTILITVLLGLFGSMMWSCNMPDQTVKIAKGSTMESRVEIPALLDRSEAIQYGKEWENVQNAYASARAVLAKKPNQLEAYLKIATVFIHEARVTGEHGHYYPGALKVLNHVCNQESETTDVRFRALSMKAAVLLSQHEFEEALTIGKEAVDINPYNAQIVGVLVDAYVELGQYDEAVKMADQMISIRPDLRSYARVSYLRQIHGDVKGSIEAMKMAVTAGFPGTEELAWTRYTLGQLYETYGDLDNAKMQYQMAMKERLDYPFAIAALAEIERKKGDYKAAEKLLKQACDIIPEVGFYEQLAGLYQETGKEEASQKLLAEIYEMLQDDVNSGHNMSMEYAALYLDMTNDIDKSVKILEAEYQKRPNNIDVNQLLATAYYHKGDLEKAVKHNQKANITNSKDPKLLCLNGLLASKQGEAKKGKEFIKTSFDANPYQSHSLVLDAKKVL